MAQVTRINLTDKYAITVEAAAKQLGVSQAEVCRMGLRALWGENLERAPIQSTDLVQDQPSGHPNPRPS